LSVRIFAAFAVFTPPNRPDDFAVPAVPVASRRSRSVFMTLCHPQPPGMSEKNAKFASRTVETMQKPGKNRLARPL
jgi:hypothetical protein